MKLIKEEDKDHKILAKEYKRLEIFIIIFMAIALCLGTFYFNVICFGTKCENKSPAPLIIIKPGKTNSNAEKTDDDISTHELTVEEATSISKSLFTNDVVRWMFDDNGSVFCKTEIESLSAKELGLNNENDKYQKCLDYNSYDEMTKEIKQYFTDKYYNTLLKTRAFLAHSRISTNGETIYNYYEKNGNLYAVVTYKGSDLNKSSGLTDATIYEITRIKENGIYAKVKAKWLDFDNNDYFESVELTIQKEENNWKISSYEVINN